MPTIATLSIQNPVTRKTLLSVSLAGNRVTYDIKPEQGIDGIRQFLAGSEVSLQLFSVNGTNPTKISWTADTFSGLSGTTRLNHKLLGNLCELQFIQRCILSGTGHAAWRLRLWNGVNKNADELPRFFLYPVSYSLTSDSHFVSPTPGPGTPSLGPLEPREISYANVGNLSFQLASGASDDALTAYNQNFVFFKGFKWSSVAAEVEPSAQGNLCYKAKGWLPNADGFSLGNGIDLAKDQGKDATLELWQSTRYGVDLAAGRTLTVCINGISTKNILDNWNKNIARRYYDGLAVDHNFSLVPEVSCAAPSPPRWTVVMSVEEKYDLSISPTSWGWLAKDAEREYPDSYGVPVATSGNPDPSSRMSTSVVSIGMMGQASVEVSCLLRMFRTHDGVPVSIDKLTLSTPQQQSDGYAWSLRFLGSGPGDTKEGVGDVSQVVRSGAFELHLPTRFAGSTTFKINCSATYGATSSAAVALPLMPHIKCTIDALPLLAVIPAGEDELDSDLYARIDSLDSVNHNTASTGPIPVDALPFLRETLSNFQRENPIVFQNPALAGQRTQDGSWSLSYAERATDAPRHLVQMGLQFVLNATAQTTGADESVLVLDRVPFTFADVHFNPLNRAPLYDDKATVATWDSPSNHWSLVQIIDQPSYLVIPAQMTAEENVTEDANNNYPQGIGDGKPPRMELGTPTVIQYATDPKRGAVRVPWDLRQLMTDNTVRVSRLDYEMLYGMACSTTAEQMRLTEAETLYGRLRGDLPAPENLLVDPAAGFDLQYLYARLHWSRVFREYQSRLGVFVVEGPESGKDPEDFRDSDDTDCRLRLSDEDVVPDDAKAALYMTRSKISPNYNNPDFKGAALDGINNAAIFANIVGKRDSGTGNAAVIQPRFSVLGGFGTVQGVYDNKRSTLINSISMGRTITYTVERIGRIGCHWNRAKHVIVYERTVVPSRQFWGAQTKSAFRGLPLIRKVEEYVEFIQEERLFASETKAPQAAFAKGFKCGPRKRISVDTAWAVTIPGQGWKVPLWNPAVADALPDVYPKPQLYLEVSTPEKAADSTDKQPKFINKDCLLVRPQEVVFFTSTVADANSDTDTWPAVESVDCVGYPLIVPDTTIYKGGDLNAKPLAEYSIPPGWEPVSFTIEAPASGVHTTDGIVVTQTPIAANLKTITVSRGVVAIPKTVKNVMQGGYDAYQQRVSEIAAVPQGFENLRKTIEAQIANASQSGVDAINGALNDLKTSCTAAQTQAAPLVKNLTAPLQSSLNDVACKLVAKINAAANDARAKLNALSGKIAAVASNQAGIDPHDPVVAEAERIISIIGATNSVAQQWTPATMQNELDRAVQSWTGELEAAILFSSPLRQVTAAFNDFQQLVGIVQAELNRIATIENVTAKAILNGCQAQAERFDNAVTGLTNGLAVLQAAVAVFDPSVVLMAVNVTVIGGKFDAVIQAGMQATVAESNQVQALTQSAVQALKDLQASVAAMKADLDAAVKLLPREAFDLLRQTPTVQNLYKAATNASAASLAALKTQLGAIRPDVLIADVQTNYTTYVVNIGNSSKTAIVNLTNWLTTWLATQAGLVAGPWNTLLANLNGLSVDAHTALAALQSSLNQYANQARGALQSASRSLDQYVRQPLMQLHEVVANESDSVMRLVRAFGDAPQVPHLDIQPPAVAYVYDYVNHNVPITPVLARANQVGQALNALGVKLPATALADALVPADLKQFDLNKILPDFSGLKLSGLFSGIKLPEIANKNIVVTHGWDPQTRRAWIQANANVPIADRMVVFQAGFFAFCLSEATFHAECNIQNNGTHVQQATSGWIKGKWSIKLSESDSLIDFADTKLLFDETGKLQFHFNPAGITLADALKSVSALIKTFSDPDSGFSYGMLPNGVKCAFALPVPDTSALTSGMTGLSFAIGLQLTSGSAFLIKITLGISTKDRPFNFSIFILGGCGYLETGVTYNIDTGEFEPPSLEMAIGCSASLAIALGPISGGVYAQFAIEMRNSGSGFRAGAFFQISGHVSLLGMISIDIVLRLEATYADGVMIATGHVSLEIHLFMFSISVSRDVTMRLGSGGQSSRVEFPSPPGNEVAALAGPDGMIPGLAAAFAAAPPSLTWAQRYVNMLL